MEKITSSLDDLFSRYKTLPTILSSEISECGVVCLAMIAQYHGHNIDIQALRRRANISSAGMTLRAVINVADTLDLSSRAIRVDLDKLKHVTTPAILHWDMNHFVVLKKVKGDTFTIHDPTAGKRVLSFEDVSKHYTGVCLELTKAQRFKKQVDNTPVRISSLWTKINGFWSSMTQVLVLALCLQAISMLAPFYIQLMIDGAVAESNKTLALTLAIAFSGVLCIRLLTSFFQSWVVTTLGMLLSFQMVGNLVRHLLRLNIKYFETRHIGDILSRISSLDPIRTAFTTDAISVLLSALMLIFSFIIIFIYSGYLTLIVIIAMCLELFIQLIVYPYRKRLIEEQIDASAKEESFLMESIRASTTLKLMSFESERESQWRNVVAKEMNIGFRISKLDMYVDLASGLIAGIKNIIIVYVAVVFIIESNGFSLGMLFAFTSYQGRFGSAASNLISKLITYKLLSVHLDRVGDIVKAEPDSFAESAHDYQGDIRITLDNVSFGYGSDMNPVLNDVSLDIKQGQSIGFVGPSGGGKTTLMKLMLGLYEPSSGTVSIGGHVADKSTWQAWRKISATLMQEDRLLSGSIEQNIAFFDPQVDKDKVMYAAQQACVAQDIERMPMGYQSLIGDMGSTLSGGQKQRILLARALYRDPKILFMDEGTANLDAQSEEDIADLIKSLPITKIIIAHRPALMRDVDEIFEVANGTVSKL